MAPKRKPTTSSGAQPKKQQSVPTLEEKLAVLDLLRDGRCRSPTWHVNMAATNLASVPSSAPITAKVMSQVRNKTLVKTEKALNLWLEDMNRKRVAIDGNTLREKGQLSDEKEFKASQGWLSSFRNCFNLKNVQITGEAASANEEAAKAYPEQLKKIIEEKDYLPEQVFNADETGLFWKKMPNRTYISKSERQAPGFKAAKDCVIVLFCGNAAGHLIKPGLLYRAANPRALKDKNKTLLPVFWQSNKKAWVTAALFLDWFHECLILEVKRYIEEKGLDFKVLLIVDNAPGHPVALRFAHNDVEVVFLPPNTTSILQPLDQGVIHEAYILTDTETLTNKELEELIKSSTEDEDDDNKQEEAANWNLHKFAEVFQAAKHLNDLISEYDPSKEQSLKITCSITDDLKPYQEMFEQLERQQRQLPITMFFKEKQPAADEPYAINFLS
ncbi:tigger transposable element-derived protein 1-like [Emys orbicularis]|uniref:tigger transposable element-derived protein 1-like n=1 Tax=Emys orbicularis TaxID=82168 RepID=UPI0031FDB07C